METYFALSTSGCDPIEISVNRYVGSISALCKWTWQTVPLYGRLPVVEQSKIGERPIPPTEIRRWKKGDTDANWSTVKKSGSIRMTDYSVGQSEKTYHVATYSVIRQPYGLIGWTYHDVYNNSCIEYPNYTWLGHDATGRSKSESSQVRSITTTRRTDAFNVHSDFPDIKTYGFDVSSFEKERMRVMSSCVSKAASDYDFLTDLAEFRETGRMILNLLKAVRRPISSLQKIIKEAKKNPFVKGSEAWMLWRYGIQPTYSSIQDLLTLYRNKDMLFQTFRSRGQADASFAPRDMSETHIYQQGSYTCTFSATGKSKYSSSALRLLARTRSNPFVTLWDIKSYSWMIDWFIDVGGWVEAQSHNYLSMASEEKFCIAAKIEKSIQTILYIPPTTLEASLPLSSYRNLYYGDQQESIVEMAAKPVTLENPVGGNFLLSTETERSYSRSLFKPSDIELQFLPQLNWQRGLDALALSALKFKSYFRRFK